MTDQRPNFVIAVVDDDQRILGSLEILLESADYAVRSFASAGALLESGCLALVDCVISDIDMPVTDGFQLLQAIRAERPDLPVILITGLPDMPNRIPAVARSYLLFKKPFDGEELLAAISKILGNQLPRTSRS